MIANPWDDMTDDTPTILDRPLWLGLFDKILREEGGETGRLIADFDWTPTSIGPISTWSQSLRTMVGYLPRSPVPHVMLWNEDGVMLYNDAYSEFAGARHPALLGSKVREGWPEVADFNDNVMKVCLAGGTLAYVGQELTLHRNGVPEPVWMNLDYSPVPDESGRPIGVMAIVVETTEKVLAERRAAEERRRQETMLQQMPGFAAILSGPKHIYTYVNDAYISVARSPILIGKTVHEALPELEGQGFFERLDEVYRTGVPFIARGMPLRLKGESADQYLDYIYQPIRGDDGQVIDIFVGGYDVTVTLRNAEALRQSEEQLRLATDLAEVGLWDVDLVEDTLYWDRRCKAMFGISPEVAVSLDDFYTGLHPEDREATVNAFSAALDPDKRSVYDVEYRTIGREDGVIRWIAAKGQGVFDESGKCVRATGTTLDITLRKQIDLRRDTLVQLHDALRLASDVSATSYEIGRILGQALGVCRVGYGTIDSRDDSFTVERDWCADGVESIAGLLNLRDFGTFVDDLKKGRFIEISDTRPDPRTASASATLERRHARSFVNVPVIEADKTVAVLYINHDKPRLWSREDIALINDVAERARISIERARAEHDLQTLAASLEDQVEWRTTERNLLATVFESTDSFIHVIDLDYHWLAINPAGANEFASAFGPYPKVGDHLLDLLNDLPEERMAVEAIWSRALAGEEFTAVREFGAPGRERKTYEMKFNRLYDKAGQRIGAYQVVSNITERVAAAARLAEAEDQLRQAQKMEAVGQLTGGIAHDFNNMLAVVLGSLDLLNRRFGAGDSRAKRQIEAASDAAKRAANLTQRLLAFSRQQPLKPEVLEANKLVSNMSDLLHHSIGADIRLETILAAGVWPIHVDPNQLENVILNLAVNARDAMPGGGRLTIETHNIHIDARYALKEPGISPGHYVMLAVTDTGGGMAPEVVSKAFDPFFTTKAVGKGTGLGLSQVYGFVKQSGGHVRIYSEIGQGTTVKIYLPRDTSVVTLMPTVEDRFDIVPGDQKELILIVDDEPAVRQFSADAFAELGYGVIDAESASVALQLIASHPEIALLFTDIVMPDINGRQLVDAAHIIRPGLKVLFSTGYTRNAVVHNGVLEAGVELIGKPFTIDELAARVREILDRPV